LIVDLQRVRATHLQRAGAVGSSLAGTGRSAVLSWAARRPSDTRRLGTQRVNAGQQGRRSSRRNSSMATPCSGCG